MTDQHQGHTLDDIAGRIEQLPGGILDFDEPEAAPEEEAAPKDKENSPSEQEPEKAEAEGEDEEQDTDKEPEEKEEPEKDESASEEDDPVYEVTLPDGQTEEVPVSELARGYLAGKELETIKAEAADVRRDYERRVQDIPEQVRRETARREQELVESIQRWADLNPPPPVPSLSMLDMKSPDYNPDAYHHQKAMREAHEAQAREGAERLRAIAQQREEQQRAYEAQEREKLKAAWPEIVEDSAKQAELVKKAGEYFGFTQEDIASIQNHKALLVLRDAIGFREMKAKAPGVREKAKAPKPKPVKPGIRKTEKDGAKAEFAETRKRLRKTGRPEDAMAVFERMSNL